MSINVQGVCSFDLKFTNIVARWKGATHDSRIWRNSFLFSRFLDGECEGYLLGDSGYACTTHVLTPILNPSSAAERRYNTAHIKTRNTIERAFGLWKSRFRCLHGTLRFVPRRCCRVIIATAILHNLAILEKAPYPNETFAVDNQEEHVSGNFDDIENTSGNALRRRIIQTVFN